MLRAACLMVAALTLGPPCVLAQPAMQTILTNGPVSNRLNIVVLSEGYTSGQLAQFAVDVTNAVNALLSHPPYREYRNYFNAFAISVASAQSGSDHPSSGIYRDTYFNSTYDPYADYLITIPSDSTGQGRARALLQTFMPNCQLPILLVNDPTYGGSDGFDTTAIASTGAVLGEMPPYPPGILTHETGHVLANLGDEYTTPYPGFPDTEEPNTTQQTNRLLIKWKAWISTNTPIPTPETVGEGVVGLFEGAHYHETGWYRPELNCAMGNLGAEFCSVCSEALVLAFYQRVRPVDAFSPANTSFSVSSTQALTFTLSLLQPTTHNLDVQWFTNGVAWTGATHLGLTLSPESLFNGTNWISARVNDLTSLVRDDPANLLSQTVTWTVDVTLPQLRLDSPLRLTDGRFVFRVSGNAPQGFVIQSSTNLVDWAPLETNYLVAGQCWHTNSDTGPSPRMFYRATTPP
jgi:hypothetical protein